MLIRAAVLAAAVTVCLAPAASAEEVTVSACVSHAGPTPDFGIYVGDITVPVLTDVAVCAFDSATATVDPDPVDESTSCANGPSVQVDGPSLVVDGLGLAVHYTADGQPSGGTLYEPPVGVGGELRDVETGPIWSIDC